MSGGALMQGVLSVMDAGGGHRGGGGFHRQPRVRLRADRAGNGMEGWIRAIAAGLVGGQGLSSGRWVAFLIPFAAMACDAGGSVGSARKTRFFGAGCGGTRVVGGCWPGSSRSKGLSLVRRAEREGMGEQLRPEPSWKGKRDGGCLGDLEHRTLGRNARSAL